MRLRSAAPLAIAAAALTACGGGSSHGVVAKSPNLYISAGITAENQGDYKGASALFQHALKLDPNNYYAHFDLGTIYQHNGENAAALSEYGAALAANPNFVSALYNEGTIYQNSNPTLALPTFQRVVALAPKNGPAFIDLGTVEVALGMKTEATRDLLKGLSLDPSLRSSLTPADFAMLRSVAKSRAGASPSASPSPSPTH